MPFHPEERNTLNGERGGGSRAISPEERNTLNGERGGGSRAFHPEERNMLNGEVPSLTIYKMPFAPSAAFKNHVY